VVTIRGAGAIGYAPSPCNASAIRYASNLRSAVANASPIIRRNSVPMPG